MGEERGRPTVEKGRLVTGRKQQVARIDYEEDTDATGDVDARIVKAVHDAAPHASILLASDYLKGTLTRATMRALVAAKPRSLIVCTAASTIRARVPSRMDRATAPLGPDLATAVAPISRFDQLLKT